VTLSEALIDDLTLLSDALEDPIVDIYAVLSVLTDDLVAAIPGYLGLTVALQVGGNPIALSTLDPDSHSEIRSSVSLTLLPLAELSASGSFAFYSGTAGAFIDLANDARWIFNLDGAPSVDQHLWPEATLNSSAGMVGLIDLRDINQAVGCLIEDGRTLAQAEAELRRVAEHEGRTEASIARRILRAISHDPEVATEH
jgi:hypothetical protein